MSGPGATRYKRGVSARSAPAFSPIVFDLDGTLVDSAFGITQALNETGLAREPIAVAQVRALVSSGASNLIKQTLNISDADIPGALEAFRRLYVSDPCRPEHVFPGAEQALARLRGWGLRLAVCTNKPQALAEIVIQRTGLAQHIDLVIGSDPGRPQKPDPAPLLEACKRLNGATPILVGDSMIDALTARAAGAPFVYAAYGYEVVADVPVADVAWDLAEVIEILKNLLWTTAAVEEGR